MEKMKKLEGLIREVVFLFKTLLISNWLTDKVLEIPQSVKKMGFKVGAISFVMTILALSFAFLLKFTNMLIEYHFIVLGIIVFMLYRAQQVVRESFRIYERSQDDKFDEIFESEIIICGSKLIGKVSNKVVKFDPKNNLYKVMSNEAVLSCVKAYLRNSWLQKIRHLFDVYEVFSILVMLIVAIVTNTVISQTIFIPLLIIFAMMSLLVEAYISIHRSNFYKQNREYNNQEEILVNDLLRVPAIVENDLDMRIQKLKETMKKSKTNMQTFHSKLNFSYLAIAILELLGQYGIIIAYVCAIDFNTITVATVAELTAQIIIVETALSNIGNLIRTVDNNSQRVKNIKKEEVDMQLILRVYYEETQKIEQSKEISNITLKPFAISYLEESENDKPFKLVSNSELNFATGDIVVLNGVSGSGKSTFMKLLTQRIRVEKSDEIPATSRFLFYDEKLKMGSLSIFEEIFCCDENPDLTKMQNILENLHLWQEIRGNCVDVWKWMQEKKFEHTLSNGQKQRIILSKMLYWMNCDIDVIVLDEATSGLDDNSETDSADAQRVLEFIVKYSNIDKKRIVIISTHQNIDNFKKNLKSDFRLRNLYFQKDGEKNVVKEIF